MSIVWAKCVFIHGGREEKVGCEGGFGCACVKEGNVLCG